MRGRNRAEQTHINTHPLFWNARTQIVQNEHTPLVLECVDAIEQNEHTPNFGMRGHIRAE